MFGRLLRFSIVKEIKEILSLSDYTISQVEFKNCLPIIDECGVLVDLP